MTWSEVLDLEREEREADVGRMRVVGMMMLSAVLVVGLVAAWVGGVL